MDDFYWNPLELGSEEESLAFCSKPYIDPWDLENYAYIREHLGSREHSKSTESPYKDQGYADIEEVRGKSSSKRHNLYSKLGEEYDEDQIYEENKKRRFYDFKDRYNRTSSMKKERRMSQSYGDFGTRLQNDPYSKVDDVTSLRKDTTLPIYTENNSSRRFDQPKHFGLSNYGHLKIDYSYSWSNLNKYICN